MKNSKLLIFPVLPAFLFLVLSCSDQTADMHKSAGSSSIYENLEFAMEKVEEPDFPDYSVSITDFGAVADAMTLNTKAFALSTRIIALLSKKSICGTAGRT